MMVPKHSEIERRRKAMGLNRTDLSRKAGLPDNAILRIERGESRYTHPIRAKAIAEALECQLEDVFILR